MKTRLPFWTVIFTLSILSIPFSSAISERTPSQEYMTYKECILSLEDPNFGPWDGTKGVVLKATNENLTLGPDRRPHYRIDFFQPEHTYFRGSSDPALSPNVTRIPVFQISTSGPHYMYFKCTYKNGDSRKPVWVSTPMYYYLTDDLGLTNGVLGESFNSPQFFPWNNYTPWIAPWNPYEYSSDYFPFNVLTPQIRVDQPNYIYYNNTVDYINANHTSYGGFYPNTEPTITWRFDLTGAPSSFVHLRPYIEASGNVLQVTGPTFGVYLNNSNFQNYPSILCPTINRMNVTHVESTISHILSPTYDYFVYANNTASTRPILAPGDTVISCVELTNNNSLTITNAGLDGFDLCTSGWAQGGIAGASTNVSGACKKISKIKIPSLVPHGVETICLNYTIPFVYNNKPVILPRFGSGACPMTSLQNSCGACYWEILGSDDVDYLLVKDKNSKLSYEPLTRQTILDVELMLESAHAYAFSWGNQNPPTLAVEPDEYSLIIQVRNQSGSQNIVKTQEITLDAAQFAKMTYLNHSTASYTRLTTGPGYTTSVWYPFTVTIDNSQIQDRTGYYVQIFAKKLKGTHASNITSESSGVSTLETGPLIYTLNNTYYFSPDSRRYSVPITLFNPDFKANNISLSVNSNSDPTHLKIELPNTTELWPIQALTIPLFVNVTYDPWSGQRTNHTFSIKASGTIAGKSTSTQLSFMVFISNETSSWANLAAYPIVSPSVVKTGKNFNISLQWLTQASESGFALVNNTNYTATLEMRDSNSSFVEGWTLPSTLDQNWVFNTTVILTSQDYAGNYTLIFMVDSDNNVSELLPSGSGGESDNAISVAFRVDPSTYCGDGIQQRPNYFGFEEQCDTGGPSQTCHANCTIIPPATYCGDGIQQRPNSFNQTEQCDDGNLNNTDLCYSNCTIPPPPPLITFCGDNRTQRPNTFNQTEQCDDANLNNSDLCYSNCTVRPPATFCGDGVTQQPNTFNQTEQCDDGNLYPGDGCTNDCIRESGRLCQSPVDCQTTECCYILPGLHNGTCISSVPSSADPSTNACLCNLKGKTNDTALWSAGPCDADGEKGCWYTGPGTVPDRCCGDAAQETWLETFSTQSFLEDILVPGICSNGAWNSIDSSSRAQYTVKPGASS